MSAGPMESATSRVRTWRRFTAQVNLNFLSREFKSFHMPSEWNEVSRSKSLWGTCRQNSFSADFWSKRELLTQTRLLEISSRLAQWRSWLVGTLFQLHRTRAHWPNQQNCCFGRHRRTLWALFDSSKKTWEIFVKSSFDVYSTVPQLSKVLTCFGRTWCHLPYESCDWVPLFTRILLLECMQPLPLGWQGLRSWLKNELLHCPTLHIFPKTFRAFQPNAIQCPWSSR